jgi:hypothetical protein
MTDRDARDPPIAFPGGIAWYGCARFYRSQGRERRVIAGRLQHLRAPRPESVLQGVAS